MIFWQAFIFTYLKDDYLLNEVTAKEISTAVNIQGSSLS
jgi:hypothetical protein